jgi:hypothetical protein
MLPHGLATRRQAAKSATQDRHDFRRFPYAPRCGGRRAMIPHRISEHVKAHDWFAVAIDLFVVILGVFVGMQVQDWNSARQTDVTPILRTYLELE